MRRNPNPMQPVLHILDPDKDWPDTLSSSDVKILHIFTAALVAEVRGRAADAEEDDRGDGPAEPHELADVRMMRWAATAGHQAQQVLRTAAVATLTSEQDAVLAAITAGLMRHVAQFELSRHSIFADRRTERHGKTVLNQALCAADWVAASQLRPPVTVDTAAEVFTNKLPPGWRWDAQPQQVDDNGEPATRFRVTRRLPEGAQVEEITFTGRRGKAVRVDYRKSGRSDATTDMTWTEVCQYLARTAPAIEAPATTPAGEL